MGTKRRKRSQSDGLDELDRKILEMVLADPNISDRELSKRLCVHHRVISRRRKAEALQSALESEQFDIIEEVKKHHLVALKKIIELIQRGNDKEAGVNARWLLNSIPDLASGLAKKQEMDGLTDRERKALAKYLEESEGKETPDEGKAS